MLHGCRSPSGRFYQEALDAAIAAHSTNSSNLELLRSVLCAGMFPSVALVMNAKSDSRKPSFSTLEDGSCRPHPCSVNGFEKFFPHRYKLRNHPPAYSVWLMYSIQFKLWIWNPGAPCKPDSSIHGDAEISML